MHGFDGSSGRRIPPVIMGHEASGVVDSTGSGVTRFQPGERVTFDCMISCGHCRFCRRGAPNLCDERRVLGVSCEDYRRDGAFAEFVSVPEHIIYKIPDSLPFDEAALVEPVSVAVHAVNRTPVQLADTAVVIGAGMIGLLTIQALRDRWLRTYHRRRSGRRPPSSCPRTRSRRHAQLSPGGHSRRRHRNDKRPRGRHNRRSCRSRHHGADGGRLRP